MDKRNFLQKIGDSIESFRRGSIENPSTPIYEALTGITPNGSGVAVNVDTTLGITAAYNANLQISQDIATLPYKVIQKEGDTITTHSDHPILKTLNEPTESISGFVFDQAFMTSYNLRGNGLAYIREKNGVKELNLVNIDGKTEIKISTRGAKFFNLELYDGRIINNVPDRNVIHVPNITFNGYWGIDPISNFKSALGLTISQSKYNEEFYNNGASIQTVIEHPAILKEGDGDRIRTEWQRLYGAGGSVGKHGLAVMGAGSKLHQVGISPEQSQFLQSRVFQVEEIARIFNMPLHKLKSLQNQPKANVEQMSKEYYSDTLQPIVAKHEIELTRKLLSEDEKANGFKIIKDMDEFLRADVKTRFEAYSLGIVNQFMTPNTVAKKEGLPLLPNGDDTVSFQTPANSNAETE